MIEVISFSKAVAIAPGKKHLLLGNGFSIALRPADFLYGALLDEATFDNLGVDGKELFALFETNDFERVIELLKNGALLVDLYKESPSTLSRRLTLDAEVVKNALAHVLAAKHPANPSQVSDIEYASGRAFLSNFERVYSLNYDLLVYWTSMQELEPPMANDDGFRSDPDDLDAPHVIWDPQARFDSQNVFYLHGALHLFDGGSVLKKITYVRTQSRLVDQIRARLDEGEYPLVVTEGTSSEKLEKILHNAYLNHARRSFGGITGSLFAHGLSFSANDEHVTGLLSRKDSKIRDLFISIHGDIADASNQAIVNSVRRVREMRLEHSRALPLAVHFYDSSSAEVWTSAAPTLLSF